MISCLARNRRRVRELLIGTVINSNHIEPRRFLENAGNVALERVRDAIERR